jgi:hypothetical protein
VNLKLNKKKAKFIDVVDFYEKRRANQTDKNCKKKICICNKIVCCCTVSHVRTKSCDCEKCNKNFDFVTKTKLKYNNITKNYIKQLIECTELHS